jgi:hypothetical protein
VVSCIFLRDDYLSVPTSFKTLSEAGQFRCPEFRLDFGTIAIMEFWLNFDNLRMKF